MYTSCPECGTVFRISTHDLRVADGHVRCGHCSATFSALATLSDEPPPSTLPVLPPEPDERPAPPVDVPEAEAETETETEAEAEAEADHSDDDTLEFDIPEDNWSSFFKDHKLSKGRQEPVLVAQPAEPVVISAADTESTEAPPEPPEPPEASMPDDDDDDDNWQELLKEVPDDDDDAESVYIIEADTPQNEPEPIAPEPVAPEQFMPADTPWDEPALDATGTPAPLPADFTADLAAGDVAGNEAAADADALDSGARADDGPHTPGTPDGWAADRPFPWTPPPPAAEEPPHRWVFVVGSVLLAVALLMQLLHQRRDELATHPALTEPLQRVYGALGIPLWPAWDLRAYEVRNYEAVADRSSRGALDILARIAVVGNDRVGLPLVRITLSDRFGQTIGSRVFRPDEYLGENPPPREPVSPGTLIPVEITLKDPGTDAQGFDVDICLMSQHDGITCQSEREPFAR